MISSNVSADSPILVDLWTVDDSRLDELMRRDFLPGAEHRGHPGFVSAQIYRSVDGGTVLLTVSTRTVKERRHLTDSPEANRALRELRAIANSHARLFELVESFGMSSHSDPRSTI